MGFAGLKHLSNIRWMIKNTLLPGGCAAARTVTIVQLEAVHEGF